MVSSFRSVARSFGGWLFAGSVVLVSASSCNVASEAEIDPARAFVETPSGRRIAFTPKVGARSAELKLPDNDFVIAKFEGPISNEARAALAAAGLREVGYLPYDALLLERTAVAKNAASAALLATVSGVAGFAPYGAEDRVARELLPESLAARTEEQVAVMIHVMPGRDRAAARAIAAASGVVQGEGQAGQFGRISVLLPRDRADETIRALSVISDVFFLERIHHIGFLNDKTAGTIQSGTQGHAAAQTPIWEHGIRGENQVVGLIDTGVDANSCYFNGTALPVTNTWSASGGYGTKTDNAHRKIVGYDFIYSCDQSPLPPVSGTQPPCEDATSHTAWDTQGHGTHVSGTMVGDSDNNPATYAAQDGMAPAAKLVAQDAGYATNNCADAPGLGCQVISLIPLFDQALKQGVSVHNNSWGDNENATGAGQSNYSARSADVDQFMWDHREFLLVFAAGNSGAGNIEFSVGSPSTNKNGLSIGSTRTSNTSTSDEDISGFSSRGWSGDGRIKPDLMAPGYNNSASNDGNVDGAANCGTTGGGGTSYAAPVAVGAAALVRQYFTEGFYPSGAKNAANALTPSAALLKGILINSGVSMKGKDNSGGAITPIPSNEQGWGRIQLDQTLMFTGGARKLYIDDHRQGLAAGATTPFTYTITGVQASQPLKITLTYTDYPGMPDSPPSSPKVDDSSTWSAPRLVNDLDLTVTGPGGTYLGNVFTSGASATGGMADKRNNVEQVLFAAPTAGDYTVTVKPVSIVQGTQEFALVATGAWTSVGAPPGGGGSDASVDVTLDTTPPTTDVKVDVEASVPDAITPRPDSTTGTGGAAGTGGSGGASGNGGSAGKGGSAGSGVSGSGGTGGTSVDGGSADAARPDANSAGSGAGGSGTPPTTGGGTSEVADDACSCSVPGRSPSSNALFVGWGLALTAVMRRKRRANRTSH